MSDERTQRLLAELDAARRSFRDALGDVAPALLTTPGLLEAWSARDLVVHVAFWSDHGADALELAASGRGAEFDYDTARTDEMNEAVFREASAVSAAVASEREEVAYRRFRAAIVGLDPALLDLALGNGHRVEEVVRYDGPDHYAEHAEHIRAWFGGGAEGDDDGAEGDDDGADA